jgi:RNA polymerase sigma-70 factor (ECF subfamily)
MSRVPITSANSTLTVVRGIDEDELTRLALAAGRGDRRAFDRWVRALQADVWQFLAYRADPIAADDLTQETFLRAYRSLPRFAGRSTSRAWLLSIARRVVVDSIRAAVSRPRLQHTGEREAVLAHNAFLRGAGRSFEDLVETRMLLDGLDPERREALVLTQVLGLSYQEAAEVCGVPIGTIRSRVARAREGLLAAIEERHEDGAS